MRWRDFQLKDAVIELLKLFSKRKFVFEISSLMFKVHSRGDVNQDEFGLP